MYTSVRQRNDNMYVSGYTAKGKRIHTTEIDGWLPTYYQPDSNGEHRGIKGEKLSVVRYHPDDTLKDVVELAGKNRQHFYDNIGAEYQFIHMSSSDGNKGIPFDPAKIKVLNFDIETASISDNGERGFPREGNSKILSIAASRNGKLSVWAYDETPDFGGADFYTVCEDEEDLLESFIYFVENADPDIITGWNVDFFDVPYLIQRIERVLGKGAADKLSPFGVLRKVYRKHSPYAKKKSLTYDIVGRSILDALALYIKFTYTQQESYALDNIAFVELGERKVNWKEMHGVETLDELYEKDFNTFIEYNVKDVVLVDKILAKLQLIETATSIAYEAGCNYADVFSPVRVWDTRIYRYLKTLNIAIPPHTDKEKEGFPGAYVKEPPTGRFKNVVSFDLASLYPHIAIMLNIGPETLVGKASYDITRVITEEKLPSGRLAKLQRRNCALAANGCVYSKDKPSFLSELMQQIYDQRALIRSSMTVALNNAKTPEDELDGMYTKQMALKILLNSAYGAIANKHFRYNDVRHTHAITATGQLAIKWAEKWINRKLNEEFNTFGKDYVITMDTDSLFLNLQSMDGDVNDIDELCKDKINRVWKRCYDYLSHNILNATRNAFQMKREIIADVGIFCAKKRYVLRVQDNEGRRQEKMKIMGLDVVKSTVPYVCKQQIRDMLPLILDGNMIETQRYVGEFEDKFQEFNVVDIAFPKGVNSFSDYETKRTVEQPFPTGTPAHIRAALVYNDMIIDKGLESKYELIKDGDKIKWVYLISPNPTHSHVIGFKSELPLEFGLYKYVNRVKMYEKTFISPLMQIIEPLGWTPWPVNTLPF